MLESKTDENTGRVFYKIDGVWEDERYLCRKCLDQDKVSFADERYSMGFYAGKYCDECWDKAGYRKDAEYDYLDAGEYYYEDEY